MTGAEVVEAMTKIARSIAHKDDEWVFGVVREPDGSLRWQQIKPDNPNGVVFMGLEQFRKDSD